jgi:kumamolisin
VSLQTYAYPQGTYRGRTGSIQIPAELAPVIEGVFGLDNRPVARRHSLRARAAAISPQGFTAPEVAKIYRFPTGPDGTGQTIAGFRPTAVSISVAFSSFEAFADVWHPPRPAL